MFRFDKDFEWVCNTALDSKIRIRFLSGDHEENSKIW
jgi:hypothetical protein